ncbi:hypothetical protein BVRB_020220 [Beta vulgaris subsp. vulgaris]|uniref:Uncharacterized protein n=1 Tax=Beta vulgaris subsp. vulgaris TaxID=3555 RepID=A0A0J8B0Q6_BETVV|nr:hypothetical protein BVRB_020220 [Beta vulgaris subsp. vulgaris]
MLKKNSKLRDFARRTTNVEEKQRNCTLRDEIERFTATLRDKEHQMLKRSTEEDCVRESERLRDFIYERE